MARELPAGTVTFLFTDIEGSTRLLDELGSERYAEALAEHRRAVREAFDRHGGVEVDTQGDAFFVAFPTAPAALEAAADAQTALAGGPVRVRMGLHTGTPHLAEEGYVGADVHRAARIAAVAHGGQVLVSSTTAELVDGAQLRDLGEHRLKDLAAPQRIHQLGDAEFPPLKSLNQTNLPVPATPFLGREAELGEITRVLTESSARLVTLTGPAGAGKTRLALQAAAEASESYPDGVFWTPLSSLRDPALTLQAAAEALNAKNGLADRIARRKLLLLLDNFEHLIDAADELPGLLEACPNLRLMVTSRELLRLPGEQAYPVPPLEARDAMELFVARARAVDPSFEPVSAVGELCARLDYLPLALELAAARVTVLSPDELLERLSKRLDLLKAGRGADPRQQTLRATIEWSYDLLDEEGRRLLARLAVFAGGCTLEAAETVCEADVDALQSLVDKSLLRRRGERFWLLETVREYARERLEERGEADTVAEAHADYFFSLAERAWRGRPDENPDETRFLAHEVDNIRRAHNWTIETGDVERELRFSVAALWSLWARGNLRELLGWLTSALERATELDPWLRAEGFGAAALAAANCNERAPAREYAAESLGLARELGDKAQIEWALRVLSFDEPDLDQRRRYLRECEELLRELGNESGRGWVTYLLGQAFADEGNFGQAHDTWERAAEIFQRLGRRWEVTNARVASAYALLAAGQSAVAEPMLREALHSALDLESVALVVESVAGLGAVRAESDPVTATRMFAAAETIADERGHPLALAYQQGVVYAALRQVRDDLAGQFDAEWESGKSLTLDEVVALAREEEP